MKTSSVNRTVTAPGVAITQMALGPGLRNPVDASRRIRAVLFDVDGTLYRQAPVRSAMALELLSLPLNGLWEAPRRWRALQAYRGSQEALRRASTIGSPSSLQRTTAARRSGLSEAAVDGLVHEWMFARPLKYLPWCRAKGLDQLLGLLERNSIATGVLSDYPAEGKLAALDLRDRFWPVLSAADAEIAALKPHPRGFLRAATLWNVHPAEVLVVGDRLDADGAGAAAAGMPCAIVGRHGGDATLGANIIRVSSLGRLCHVLAGRG